MGRGGKVAVVIGLAVVVVALAIPAHQGYKHRGRIGDAIGDGFRPEVKAAIVARLTRPTAEPIRNVEFTPRTRYVRAINVDYRGGSVYILLDADAIGHHEIEPKSWISYTAVVRDGAVVDWKCGLNGVPAKLAPAACR
jgi:hypothetical protein